MFISTRRSIHIHQLTVRRSGITVPVINISCANREKIGN